MRRALAVTWFAMRSLYDELFLMAGMGFIWFLVALVFPYGVYYLVSLTGVVGLTVAAVLVSLIPLPPVTGALYSVAMHIAREKRIEFSLLWEGFKSHFWQSWKIGAVVLVGIALLAVAIPFYLGSENLAFKIVGFVTVWLLIFWAAIQIYLLPLSLIQEDNRLRVILKNASLLTLAFPLYGLIILVVAVLATALSVLLLLFMLATVWMPFIAILFCRATISSVQEVEAIRKNQEELEEEISTDEEQDPD